MFSRVSLHADPCKVSNCRHSCACNSSRKPKKDDSVTLWRGSVNDGQIFKKKGRLSINWWVGACKSGKRRLNHRSLAQYKRSLTWAIINIKLLESFLTLTKHKLWSIRFNSKKYQCSVANDWWNGNKTLRYDPLPRYYVRFKGSVAK